MKMCSTKLLRPLYILALIMSIIFTAGALFSPAWRIIDEKNTVGLINNKCSSTVCRDHILTKWEKSVLGLLLAALILQLVLLIWGSLSWMTFFMPGCYIGIALISLVSLVCLLIAVGVYASNRLDWTDSNLTTVIHQAHKHLDKLYNHLGYSFWMAVVAAIFMVFTTAISLANSILSFTISI